MGCPETLEQKLNFHQWKHRISRLDDYQFIVLILKQNERRVK